MLEEVEGAAGPHEPAYLCQGGERVGDRAERERAQRVVVRRVVGRHRWPSSPIRSTGTLRPGPPSLREPPPDVGGLHGADRLDLGREVHQVQAAAEAELEHPAAQPGAGLTRASHRAPDRAARRR